MGDGGDAASKVVLKVGAGVDEAPKLAVKVGDGAGSGGSCCPNMGTCGFDGSPKHVVEAGGGDSDDVSYAPMLGCCSCNLVRKHLVAEEGGCEGACPRNLRSCDWCGSPKHVGHGRLRLDAEGHLYVLDTEAEDSDMEESCRPVLRQGQGVVGRRLAATGEVALEASTTKGIADADGELTEEMVHYIEQCLTGIEEANREVFIPWIKVLLLTALLRKIQIKGMANIMNWCIIKEARFPCSL